MHEREVWATAEDNQPQGSSCGEQASPDHTAQRICMQAGVDSEYGFSRAMACFFGQTGGFEEGGGWAEEGVSSSR